MRSTLRYYLNYVIDTYSDNNYGFLRLETLVPSGGEDHNTMRVPNVGSIAFTPRNNIVLPPPIVSRLEKGGLGMGDHTGCQGL